MDNKPILIKPFLKKSRTNHPEVKYDETIYEIVQRLLIIKRETGKEVEVYYKGIHVSTEGHEVSLKGFYDLLDFVIREYAKLIVARNYAAMEPNEEMNNSASKKHSSKKYYESIFSSKDKLFDRYQMENGQFGIRLSDKVEDLVLWDDYVINRGNKEIRYHYDSGTIHEIISHVENGQRIIERETADKGSILRYIQTSYIEEKMKKEIEGQEFVPMKTFDKTRLAPGETAREYRDRKDNEVNEITETILGFWNKIDEQSMVHLDQMEDPIRGTLHAIDDLLNTLDKKPKSIDDSDPHDNR
jgi:hypothetical protein